MAVISIPQAVLVDPFATDMGLLGWSANPHVISAATAPVSRTLYCVAVPTTAGVIYNGLKLNTGTAGTSTAPTGFFVGLATQANIGSAGTMLAQSNNLNSSANLTTQGVQNYAFNATYTETVTGFRIALLFIDGTFAGTNVTLSRGAVAGSLNAGTAALIVGTAGSAVTAFQANGNALAGSYSTSNTPLAWWIGLY